jgi:hypothetical protein
MQERNHLIVWFVISPLFKHHISGSTLEFKLGRNILALFFVKSSLVIYQLSRCIVQFTQERKHWFVHSVMCLFPTIQILGRVHTEQKSFSCSLCEFHSVSHISLGSPYEFTQAGNFSSICYVSSLGIHQLSANIWEFTLQLKSKAVLSVPMLKLFKS